MTPHVTAVTTAAYELPMPVPWGPGAMSQYLITAAIDVSDGGQITLGPGCVIRDRPGGGFVIEFPAG